MRKSAFTLVQAIVVIALLLLLAAILFPIFGGSSKYPYRPYCQSNLKQISLGFLQYAQDYDERFPIVVVAPASSAARYHEPYGWVDSLQPYLKSMQIFQCPAEKNQRDREFKPWEAGCSDYYTNLQLVSVAESKIRYPASTILLGEGNDGLDVNDARYAHPSIPPAWRDDTSSPLYRHLESCNYAFADGHVKWLKVELAPGTAVPNGKVFTFRVK